MLFLSALNAMKNRTNGIDSILARGYGRQLIKWGEGNGRSDATRRAGFDSGFMLNARNDGKPYVKPEHWKVNGGISPVLHIRAHITN